LTILNLGHNFIPNLDGIQFPSNLKELSLNDNILSHVSGVRFPNGLTKLNLSNSEARGDDRGGYGYNQLKSFNDVKFPPSLTELNLQRNRIETIGKIIEPSENVLQLIERQFPKIVEQYRQNITRQSQQTRQVALKEVSDFNQISLQNQLRGITSFLREGMEARAQQHIETLKSQDETKQLIYVHLPLYGKNYPVPVDNFSQSIQSVVDYLIEHYYISSLLPDCGAIVLYNSGNRMLEPQRSLADYNIERESVLSAQCRIMKITSGGGRMDINKESKKWSMKYKRSINCRRPRGFSQRQHCKYGRRGWKHITTLRRRQSVRD